jgi:hypothetical protein
VPKRWLMSILDVVTLVEQAHGRHGSILDLTSDGDSPHSLASLVVNQADKA